MVELASKIKALRKSAGLTQQQVADALEIKRSAYAYYEIGKSFPKLSVIKKMAALFNVTGDELLSEEQDSDLHANSNFDLGWRTTDGFNQLSDFEQSVLLRVRLMSYEDREKLMDYLSTMNI